MTFPSAGVWMMFGAGLKKILADLRHQKVFNLTMALVLAASVAPIAWNLVAKYI
jgi:threonine/homoserine/homoserine lactone efflux protein